MCGRFALTLSAKVLADVFEAAPPPDHTPRFNVCPTQTHPVVRLDEGGDRSWHGKRWGLVPFWAKELKIGARMINARSETAPSKPAFRAAVKTRRCLVPADGWYEWRREAGGKQPYFIHRADAGAIAFAGLWERWQDPDDEIVETYTILTTSAHPTLADVHDRMPVVLAPADWDEWLAPRPLAADRWEKLSRPAEPEPWELYPISRRVNSPANDDPAILERVDPV